MKSQQYRPFTNQPRFETCLYGPSATPISLKKDNTPDKDRGASSQDVERNKANIQKEKKNKSLQRQRQRQRQGEEEITEANLNMDEKIPLTLSIDTGSSQHDQAQDEEKKGEEPISAVPVSVATTPPQTPLRPSRPSRPVKPPSTSKKNKEKRDEANVNASSQTSASSSSPTTQTAGSSYVPPALPHTINIQELRRLSSQGVPDHCTLRPLAWRVLLGYLPLDTSKWQATMDRERLLYRTLVNELFILRESEESGDPPENERDELYNITTFEEEGWKLRGQGLRIEGKKVVTPLASRATSPVNHEDAKKKVEAIAVNVRDSLWRANLLDEAEAEEDSEREEDDDDDDDDDDSEQGGELNSNSKSNLNDSTDANANGSGIEDDVSDDDKGSFKQHRTHESTTLEERMKIPPIILEQWRRSGRDPESLIAGMGFKPKTDNSDVNENGDIAGDKPTTTSSQQQPKHFNVLLVTNNDTASAQSNDEYAVRKINITDDDLDSNNNARGGETLENIDPKWKHFLENASLLDEIRKDVVRTHPDLQFYLDTNKHLGLRRYAAIERILFIWAKLNKGVRYVQGMNEIVGTMYFVLANDSNEEWASQAEADTYFLFNTLMVEMRDIFVPDLDEADTGIQGRMQNMLSLLSLHDPDVRCHLDDCGIDPGFYSIRWLTTLLSREFLLPDTIRLWDSMFASTHKDNFMRYVCVCMVMIIREDLLRGDFGTCLRLLQSYPPTDVDKLLESSRALWIYESQVTLACHKGGISLSQALTTIAPPPAVIMAYGLNGGLALDQLERMRKEVMQSMASNNGQKGRFRMNNIARSVNNTSATASKSFFGFFNNKK